MLMSVIWIAAAITALLWAKWRMTGNAMEIAQCERLLAKFQEATNLESRLPGL
jgi:hypothetical protein